MDPLFGHRHAVAGLIRTGRTADWQESPLLLFPVKLDRPGPETGECADQEEAAVNPALWLRQGELGVEMPDFDPEEAIDVNALFAGVRATISGQPKLSASRAARRVADV